MGFYYVTERIFNVGDVVNIRDRAKEVFSDNGMFNNFSPADMGHGEYIVKGQLPELMLAKGISFAKFTIFENLPAQEKSIDKLRSLLDHAGSIVNNLNQIHVEVTYEEKNSQQTKRFADRVEVGYRNEKQEYSYSAVGSMVGSDIDDRKIFFKQLISDLNLPLQLSDGDNGFSLQHIEGGELFVSMGNIYKKNPSLFKCEVSQESNHSLFSLLERTLQNYGSGKCFEYKWSVVIGDLMRPREECADVKKGYEMLRAQNFPAQKSHIVFAYYLDEIEGIETLRGLCGAKKNFLTEICSFTLPNKNSATLTANTCSEGHRLELYLSDIDCLAEIEEKLGLKFTECAK